MSNHANQIQQFIEIEQGIKTKHSINLKKIICNEPSERTISGDEFYLYLQSDARFGIRIPSGLNNSIQMKKGDVMNIANNGKGAEGSSLTVYFLYELLLTLWDHDVMDDPNTATFLVNHQFVKSSYTLSADADDDISIRLTNQDGADYTIVYNTYGCA